MFHRQELRLWKRKTRFAFLVFSVVMVYSYSIRSSTLGNANTLISPRLTTTMTSDNSLIVEVGKRIQSKTNKTVLVTIVNDSYLTFAYSWLCNTIYMDIHKHVLIITTDTTSRDKLRRDWPTVSTVAFTGMSFHGDLEYSHAGYVRLMIRRTEVLLALLNAGIQILLFETDFVWIKNPLPLLEQESEKYDILALHVSDRPKSVCGCFIYMRPLATVKNLWRTVTDRLHKLEAEITKLSRDQYVADNDQNHVSELIHAKLGGLTYKKLSPDLFPDGKWYSYTEAQQKSLDPFIIHNNWIIGNKPKLNRAKKWLHWFLNDNATSCNMDAVNKIVQK